MTLIPQSHPLPFEPGSLEQGRGGFLAAGGTGHESKRITVHYYAPTRLSPASSVLIVIPGVGRNSEDYRDAWVDTAEEANVLVAALGYPAADYDVAAYHMGGVIKNLRVRNAAPAVNAAAPTVWRLRDEDISFERNDRRDEWLFPDFDRIFELLVAATGSAQTHYDLFGHSAGAQVLHRLVLFHPASRARRILAANAGLYTLPRLDEPPITGLQGTGVTEESLAASLGAHLVVLLGEADNDGEVGDMQLHTPLFDRQGVDRLSRGRTFFETGRERARAMQVPFGWTLELVPDVGHDHRGMAVAAARHLYDPRRATRFE